MYEIKHYVSGSGRKPVLEFMLKQDKEIQDWLLAGIKLLGQKEGKINSRFLQTKHIKGKIFELKYVKLAVRMLFSYHPNERKIILLLHGVMKKRDDLRKEDIDIAETRYKSIKFKGDDICEKK